MLVLLLLLNIALSVFLVWKLYPAYRTHNKELGELTQRYNLGEESRGRAVGQALELVDTEISSIHKELRYLKEKNDSLMKKYNQLVKTVGDLPIKDLEDIVKRLKPKKGKK